MWLIRHLRWPGVIFALCSCGILVMYLVLLALYYMPQLFKILIYGGRACSSQLWDVIYGRGLHRHRYMRVRKTSTYKQLNFLSIHRLIGGKVGVSLNCKVWLPPMARCNCSNRVWQRVQLQIWILPFHHTSGIGTFKTKSVQKWC